MAITTLDGVLAGMQPAQYYFKEAHSAGAAGGIPLSYWSQQGIPGPGSFSSSLNGATLSAPVDGAIPFTNPASGNTYLNRFWTFNSSQSCTHVLCDRLWHNGGITITSTSPQSITSPTWPARDNNGSTNGEGVLLAVEVETATGAGTPTLTVSYTNSAGTSGRTATNTNLDPTAASAGVGRLYRLELQAGDIGVRSVQSITLSATWTSGTIHLVAYRVIAVCEQANGFNGLDLTTGGMPRIFDDSVLWPWVLQWSSGQGRIGLVVQCTQG